MSIDASGGSLSAGLPCVKPSRTASSLSLQAHRFAPFSHSCLTRPPLRHQSFFGGLTIGRVSDPDYTLDRVALVASPHDLLATKIKVLLQRAERKDYQDVVTLLDSGLALSDGLAAAQALYGSGFPVRECLKALVYFADGDLAELGSGERRRLEQAVLAVDGIPSLKRISWELGPSQP